MSNPSSFDQSKFDATIKEALLEHDSSTWPKFLNKRMFFACKAAIPETPRVPFERIEADLAKLVYTRQGGGPPRQVPLGIALASKKASEGWSSSKRFAKLVKRNRAGGRGATPEMEAAAWDAEVKAKLGKIRGGRKVAAGFLRLGWLYAMKALQPFTGLSFGPSVSLSAKAMGIEKGAIKPATPGNLRVTAENFAHARSETRGGFARIGQPALNRAMAAEEAELRRHLEEDMEPAIREFNRKQK